MPTSATTNQKPDRMGDRCGAGCACRQPDSEQHCSVGGPSQADAGGRCRRPAHLSGRVRPKEASHFGTAEQNMSGDRGRRRDARDTSPKADRSKFGKTKAYLRLRIACRPEDHHTTLVSPSRRRPPLSPGRRGHLAQLGSWPASASPACANGDRHQMTSNASSLGELTSSPCASSSWQSSSLPTSSSSWPS